MTADSLAEMVRTRRWPGSMSSGGLKMFTGGTKVAGGVVKKLGRVPLATPTERRRLVVGLRGGEKVGEMNGTSHSSW